MRGKPRFTAKCRHLFRITPADAGKTVYRCLPAERYTDHPRGCGENRLPEFSASSTSGSPPQVRGKPADCCMMQGMARITPAGAGKTACQAGCTPILPDHPRGCGENRMSRECRLSDLGSPPRMRGKRLTVECNEKTDRITPADAGKTTA